MPKEDHPLGMWFDADPERRTYDGVSDACRSAGFNAGPEWIKQIAIGFDGPRYPLAEFLSEKVTKGAVTVKELMNYPYSKEQPRKRRRTKRSAA